MEGDHYGAGDQKTHGVGDHQAAQEDQEGARAAVCPAEGLDEHHESDEIGGDTQSGEDGWEVGRCDAGLVRERRAVYGVAEWGVVGEWRDGGIHGFQLVWGN